MTRSDPQRVQLEHEYSTALRDCVSGAGEVALAHAYELGRMAAGTGIGVVELAAIHDKALQEVLQRQREESARVAGEMQAAQRIQLDTLPRPESIQDPRVELAAAMEPALEVGGDLYDFYRLDERRLFVLLGDVSGKGLPASIFMAVSKALCKSTVLRADMADVGKLVAERATEKGVKEVVFDRGRFLYHGRVKALADAAREGGLSF